MKSGYTATLARRLANESVASLAVFIKIMDHNDYFIHGPYVYLQIVHLCVALNQ